MQERKQITRDFNDARLKFLRMKQNEFDLVVLDEVIHDWRRSCGHQRVIEVNQKKAT